MSGRYGVSGYYWVKLCGEWMVAYYDDNNNDWNIIFFDGRPHKFEDFDEIGKLLCPPDIEAIRE